MKGLFELQTADPDKGGHRDQAIDLVHRAIDQVNQGHQFSPICIRSAWGPAKSS